MTDFQQIWLKIKEFFQEDAPRSLALHIGVMAVLALAILLFFFYIYLPTLTMHGQTITVPDLTGRTVEEIISELEDLELRYGIADSGEVHYRRELPPYTILAQDPPAGEKVKLNRRIYLTVNPSSIPMAEVPFSIISGSLRNAIMMLKSYNLDTGKVEYVDHPDVNAVQAIRYKGVEYKDADSPAALRVPKGSRIDLLVGNGLGSMEVQIPNLVGMPLEEAEVLLNAFLLTVGTLETVANSGKPAGTVMKQEPAFREGATIRQGEAVHLWVADEDQ